MEMVLFAASLMLSMLGLISAIGSGSITKCCEQGQKFGSRMIDGPLCVEENLDYSAVGRVSKLMCKKVFISCCHYTSMEQNCKAGVQSAINGFHCKAGKAMGGEMKNKCCICCKLGLLDANRGENCDGTKDRETLCMDSFTACCNNARLSLNNASAPQTSARVEKLECSSYGCQQTCAKVSDGKVKCECNKGYKLKADNKSCEDIDECAEGTATCDAGNMCHNEPGSYMCIKRINIKETPCSNAGYIRNSKGQCVDDDECANGTAACTEGQYCINTDGHYACFRSCPYGYRGVGNVCQDIDECARSNPCQKHYKCVNKRGTYGCKLASCNKGFELSNDQCLDIDECARGLHDCGVKYACKNTVGSFTCQLASCIKGYKLVAGRCHDMNECIEKPGICGKGTCYNTYGSFTCGCHSGYQFNSRTSRCEDIDECTRSPGICEAGCVNTVGSYRCACPKGYQSFGDRCEDIDECALARNRCPADTVCFNEYGNFTCINATCPNKYYVQRSSHYCRLFCPGNHGACVDMVIQSIKWRTNKFRKSVYPRGYKFTYSLRVSTYLPVQINFSIVSGNERGFFYLQRLSENSVDLINIRRLNGPSRYTLRLDADVLYRGKVTSKFVYFIYLSISKYSF